MATLGDAFGPAGNGYLRLCFSVTPEEIAEAFERLEAFARMNGIA